MSFDPRWLRSFAMVAELGSFTAAACRSGMRQSTVSDHVRKLEAQCGRRLLVRDTHRVAITRDGEAMLAFAATILEHHERAHRHFREDAYVRIRLGVCEDFVLGGLSMLLRTFAAMHPRTDFEIAVSVSEHLRERLEVGDIDVAFLKRRPGSSDGQLVWREALVWIASPDFRMDDEQPVPLVMLSPPALTRSAALHALQAHGRAWRIVCTSGSQSGVHAAVMAGLGVAPHARSLAPAGATEITGVLPLLGETEFAVLSSRGLRSGPVKDLLTMISNIAHAHPGPSARAR